MVPRRIYDWKRFWSARESHVDLSDDGFLVDPESEHARYRGSAVTFDSIAHTPVLGLLGEPGIGKSTALEGERDRVRTSIEGTADDLLWVDLAAYGTDALLHKVLVESPQFAAWTQHSHKLHLFLDSLDQGKLHINNISAFLVEVLRPLPVERLFVRFGCRTLDWPNALESGLRRQWGEEKVGVFKLAPLRRRDVAYAATIEGANPELFLAAVERAGAGVFANRPITLRFLLNKFQQNEELPKRQVDLYRDGCRLLCEESNEIRRDAGHRGRLLPVQRLAVARRIAAVMIFCGRNAIWMGADKGDVRSEDIPLYDLVGEAEGPSGESFKVDLDVVRETLDITSLFSSRASDQAIFAHHTYAEFLAADYLVTHQLPAAEMLRMISHSDGDGPVAPQLRETAAWLASIVPEVFERLLANDAETLLRSSVPASDRMHAGR